MKKISMMREIINYSSKIFFKIKLKDQYLTNLVDV